MTSRLLGLAWRGAVDAAAVFRSRGRQGRTSRWVAGAGVFALAYIVALTAYGYMAK